MTLEEALTKLKTQASTIESQTSTIESQTSTIESQTTTIESQAETIESLESQLAILKRLRFGEKRERVVMPPVEKELERRRRSAQAVSDDSLTESERALKQKARRAQINATRKARAEHNAMSIPEVIVEHKLSRCTHCSCSNESRLDTLGSEDSFEVEFVPSHFVRRRHKRATKRCRSCNKISTAAAPPKVLDGGKYGPGFHAHAVVSKC